MEGSQAAQQPQQPPARRWLAFAEWLRQQAGGAAEEAVSEASASDAEEADLPLAEPGTGTPLSTTSGSRGGNVLTPRSTVPALPSPGQLARHATLAPRLPDCRAETRLTSESCSRARQEMTVLLAAPGMPLHQAPVLTAKQASALMAAICEPLLSLPVGRLTRKLSAPTKLQPTPDRGQLSLWLLPDDSLSLVWQSAVQLPPAELAAATAGSASDGSISSSSSSSSTAGSQAPELQQSCSVAVWEELAHFPAQAHLQDDAPGEHKGFSADLLGGPLQRAALRPAYTLRGRSQHGRYAMCFQHSCMSSLPPSNHLHCCSFLPCCPSPPPPRQW